MTELRLLTLNALYKGNVASRLTALRPFLADYDLVCLQEVVYRRFLRLLGSGASMFASGTVLIRGGLVTISQFPLRDKRFSMFRPRRPVRPEWLLRKGFQESVVETPGLPLVLVNTHLSANRDDDWSPGNRYARVAEAELASLGVFLETVELPVVVTGDLNLPRASATLRSFCTAHRLRDAMEGDTRPTYRPTPEWPHPPALDHVLYRPGLSCALTVTSDLVLQDLPVSDHYGIASVLTLHP